MGGIPEAQSVFNYNLVNHGTSGVLLPDGAFINRHFKSNEFEYYVQDSWRVKPNLNITFGIRHTILQTPYETNGQQVSPTVDTDDWFRKRGAAAAAGNVYEPNLTFYPSGVANRAPGYWAKQKLNIAPRLAIAYSPDTKTSIRAGFGMYFDHFGEGIVNSFDQLGSFGLSTQLANPAGVYTNENAPRFTASTTSPATRSAHSRRNRLIRMRHPRKRLRVCHHLGRRQSFEDALLRGDGLVGATRIARRLHARGKLRGPPRASPVADPGPCGTR